MTNKVSQSRKILAYLQAGNSLTALDALYLFSCMRLGARIYDLKQEGHVIRTQLVKDENSGARYARYALVSKGAI